MKQYFALLFSLAFSISLFAQSVPQGIPFQAVARDLNGQTLANKEVKIRINLMSSSAEEIILYQEFHQITTNQLGLFDLVIGKGRATEGTFDNIPWANQEIWIELAINDQNDGSDYKILSNSQLLSVPYAMHSGTASELVPDSQTSFMGPYWKTTGNTGSFPQFNFLGNVDAKDLNFRTSNLNRLTIEAGGDINIENSLDVGVDLAVGNDASIGRDLSVGRDADIDNNLNVDGQTDLNGALNVNNMSPTNLTGTLNVDGQTDLNSALNVNNMSPTDLSGTLNVDGTTDLNSSLTVDGATDLNSSLNVDGQTDLNSALNVNNMSPTDLSGTLNVDGATDLNSSLTVDGATDLNSSLNVDGAATFNSTTSLNGQVTIDATLAGGQGSYGAYPLRVQGSDQGISILVNGNREQSKNFLTFWDASGRQGRIEGQTLSELQTSFEFVWFQTQEALQTAFQIAIVAVDVVGVDDADAAIVEGLELVDIIANWAVMSVHMSNNAGVAFESGSGDYAEWLEKANASETFTYGDIVGVKGGKISKNMSNPDNYMVISKSPIVLGNMPVEGKEESFEKVAFMGQVPVKIKGSAQIGDYIIDSGLNDGFGIAVAKEDMTLDMYEKIVGIAWSGSDNANGFSTVNVAVGINNNDLISKIRAQQKEINEVKNKVNGIIAYLKEKDPDFDISLFDLGEAFEMEEEAEEETVNMERDHISRTIIKLLEDNEELVQNIQAEARRILAERNVDYKQFDQTKLLIEDQEYLKNILIDLSK